MKQTLLDIKRTTTITTKAIAQQAQLPVAEVFVVETGGFSYWETVQKVVRAFNQLSGIQVMPEDIRLSGRYSLQQQQNRVSLDKRR